MDDTIEGNEGMPTAWAVPIPGGTHGWQ
jgi:hypothetical protein